MKKVTAIFDIGKTNKKFFLFDQHYQEVHREYTVFDLIQDEDGYPCEDLEALTEWLKNRFDRILKNQEFEIEAINFSTYGASFVHIDRDGKALTPLYDYTKVIPEEISSTFYTKYGPKEKIARDTGSPPSGMLNSGLQLYWIKHSKPHVYEKIYQSLHFPQYLSYLFTGLALCEYTSTGCHTMLWDYTKKDYHQWVYDEGIHLKLPPLVSASTSINMRYHGRHFRIGVGIHDSSAALLPYIKGDQKPFVLVSTGTWCISLNPFTEEIYNDERKGDDQLCYMRINGDPVVASRLFLGQEYKLQVKEICKHFVKGYSDHRHVQFDPLIYQQLRERHEYFFSFQLIRRNNNPDQTSLDQMSSFEMAFHQLMFELMEIQIEKIKIAIGNSKIKRIYIDGGFADNQIFVELIAQAFPGIKLRTTRSPLGSALGAAMVISPLDIPNKFLKQNYQLKKHKPIILK